MQSYFFLYGAKAQWQTLQFISLHQIFLLYMNMDDMYLSFGSI